MDKRAVIMWLFVVCFLGVLLVSWRIVGIQKSVYTDANKFHAYLLPYLSQTIYIVCYMERIKYAI